MTQQAAKIAAYLLKIKAVRLEPKTPFTWASGWKSPVYCDNRLSLSFPELRDMVCAAFVDLVRDRFPNAHGIAGVATAGIPQGVLVADRLKLPFVYIRSSAKAHGLTNQIEGKVEKGADYVVLEDLVSTGGSSLKAAQALADAGGTIAGVVSVFSYGFPQAEAAFEDAGWPFYSLLDLDTLLEKAREINYIQPADMEVIRTWRQDPANWTPHLSIEQN